MSAAIGRIAGALIVLAAASIPGIVVAAGLFWAPSQTGWAYRVPRDDPTLSGGDPAPPWRLVDWLYGAAIEITAFAVLVTCLVVVFTLTAGARRNVEARGRWRLAMGRGFWVWSAGVLAMSVFAAVLHVQNWAEWHALLDADVHIPYYYEPLQAPVGSMVMVAVGLAPLVAAFLLRRRCIAREVSVTPVEA